MSTIIFALITAFAVTAILGPVTIPFLKRLKFGQSIREDGPQWHQIKSGTPTMGGIMFIIGIIAAAFIWTQHNPIMVSMLGCVVAFGLIGFIDDYIKVVKKQNLGLRAWQKFSLQLLVSVFYTIMLVNTGIIDTQVIVPFMEQAIDFKMFYIPFVIFMLLATVNSVNLTDGLDGLASFVTFIVSGFLTITAFLMKETNIAIFSAAVTGGCLAFLLFNAYPAKVFMGDVGSLFLGGCVCVTAISLKLPLVLIIFGGVYFAESLSVVLQVASFQLTGKRIFKMSPIHHHFEMCGYSEVKIVWVFTLTSLILAGTSYFCIMNYIF